MTSISADAGGYSENKVSLNDDVGEAEAIAVQMNAFGDGLKKYVAP